MAGLLRCVALRWLVVVLDLKKPQAGIQPSRPGDKGPTARVISQAPFRPAANGGRRSLMTLENRPDRTRQATFHRCADPRTVATPGKLRAATV
jgi:hypothetical protein